MRVLVADAEGFVEAAVDSVDLDGWEDRPANAVPVYDLEVARAHTYVADGVLVHNSIYQFRGADIRNIMEFEEAFPDATVIVLEQNYRSTQTILDAANAVIANNLGRKPKELWTDQGQGQAIVRYHADDEGDESQWVAHQIAHLHDGDHRWGDVAVFYRTNAQSRVMEDQLMRSGIPYKVIGGTRFYDRREVKDALAYLKVVANPDDEVSVKRVLNTPKRGVGDGTVARLDAWANGEDVAFIEALRRADDAGVTGRAVRGIEAFLELVDDLTAQLEAGAGPGELLEAVLARSGYVRELEAEHSIEAEGRIENLAELVGAAAGLRGRRRLPRTGRPGRRHRRAGRRRVVGRAHDPALGQGARVPGRVPHGDGGRRVPPPPLHRRARPARGGAPPGLRRHHPGPRAAVPVPRLEPHACTARPSTTRRAGSWTRSPTSSSSRSRGRRGSRRAGSGSDRGGRGFGATSGGRTGRATATASSSRRCKPAPPSPSHADRIGLRVGDDVRHATFGEGVIQHIEGGGRQGPGPRPLRRDRDQGAAAQLGPPREDLTPV